MFAWGLRIKIYVPEPTKTIFCENFSFKLVQRTLKEENGVGGALFVCLTDTSEGFLLHTDGRRGW